MSTKRLNWQRTIIAALVCAGMPAAAQQAPSGASRIAITPNDCSNIQVYKTPPGVKYQPGVDAQGRAVAPADLGNRRRIEVPKDFAIEITRTLPGVAGGSSAKTTKTPAFDAKAYLGYVTVKDGRAYYNGQPLGDPEARAIAEACAAQMK
ncbi:MAG: hypothetical protein HYR63_19500 [Proteobacteria bacterium]|nr:hypothetical protein [Pseudomonadota bacterium]MBI3498899.1 hypothetical protein [Pseudomonadota bacterium]